MEKKVVKDIPVIFQNIEQFEKEDLRFVKVKIWLMHLDKNLNGSIFTKESVEKALPTLANTPILAFIEENPDGEIDYSDHRMVLHRKEDGDVSIKYLGQAIGLIPETNNAQWEKRVTDDGEELEYLTVEGLLWTKWDDPIDIIKRKGITAQSMELSDSYTGHWNDEGYFVFEDFQFFGACLLGNHVLPAMRNSTVEMQFSANEDMRKIIENKLNEFNTLFSEKQGGNDLEETKQEFENQEEQVDTTETQSNELDNNEEEKVDEVSEEFAEETQTESDTKVEDETNDDKSEEQPTTEVDEEFEQTQVESENTETVDEDKSPTIESDEETVNEFEVKFNDLTEQFNSLQSELDELRAFKRETLEKELSAKFEGQLDSKEITEVFGNSKAKSLEDIEVELFALVGKKNFSMQQEAKQEMKIAVSVEKDTQKPKDPYNGFFEKYLNK